MKVSSILSSSHLSTVSTALCSSRLSTVSTPLCSSRLSTVFTPLCSSRLSTVSTPLCSSHLSTVSTALCSSRLSTASTALCSSRLSTVFTTRSSSDLSHRNTQRYILLFSVVQSKPKHLVLTVILKRVKYTFAGTYQRGCLNVKTGKRRLNHFITTTKKECFIQFAIQHSITDKCCSALSVI
jgi:hypothetical protein